MTYDVVIVDDTQDIRDLLTIVLKRSGQFSVVGEAGDGAEGIDVVAEREPDLVLLDIAMPVLDGLQALPRIREVSPRSCVVILSGYPPSAAEKGALDAGAFAYVEKENLTNGFVDRLLGLLKDFRGT